MTNIITGGKCATVTKTWRWLWRRWWWLWKWRKDDDDDYEDEDDGDDYENEDDDDDYENEDDHDYEDEDDDHACEHENKDDDNYATKHDLYGDKDEGEDAGDNDKGQDGSPFPDDEERQRGIIARTPKQTDNPGPKHKDTRRQLAKWKIHLRQPKGVAGAAAASTAGLHKQTAPAPVTLHVGTCDTQRGEGEAGRGGGAQGQDRGEDGGEGSRESKTGGALARVAVTVSGRGDVASALCRGKEVELARGAIMEDAEWPAIQRGGTGCIGGGIRDVAGGGEGRRRPQEERV